MERSLPKKEKKKKEKEKERMDYYSQVKTGGSSPNMKATHGAHWKKFEPVAWSIPQQYKIATTVQ
jgi:hypothetical protein